MQPTMQGTSHTWPAAFFAQQGAPQASGSAALQAPASVASQAPASVAPAAADHAGTTSSWASATSSFASVTPLTVADAVNLLPQFPGEAQQSSAFETVVVNTPDAAYPVDPMASTAGPEMHDIHSSMGSAAQAPGSAAEAPGAAFDTYRDTWPPQMFEQQGVQTSTIVNMTVGVQTSFQEPTRASSLGGALASAASEAPVSAAQCASAGVQTSQIDGGALESIGQFSAPMATAPPGNWAQDCIGQGGIWSSQPASVGNMYFSGVTGPPGDLPPIFKTQVPLYFGQQVACICRK